MLKSRILELLGTIPAESKIYAESADVPAGTPTIAMDVLLNRRALALLDPAFAWKFAQAFAQLRQPLPAIVSEPLIKQAYAHISGQAINEDINEAQIFQHPKWGNHRGFLEALLLLPDLRLDEVAKHVGVSVSVVMLYEHLFWSVRDRLAETMFINELCYPQSSLVECRGEGDYFNEATPRDLMLRAAYHGDLETVMQIFGSRTPQTEQSAEVSAKRVKTRILADADLVVRAGGAGSKVPVLDAARRMISAAEKFAGTKPSAGDDVIGLTAIGLDPGQSIMATLEGLVDNTDYNRRVAIKMSDPKQN